MTQLAGQRLELLLHSTLVVRDQHAVHYLVFSRHQSSSRANDHQSNPDRPILMLKATMEHAIMPPAKKQLNKTSKLLKSFQRMMQGTLRL
jgi:hypothetical protein